MKLSFTKLEVRLRLDSRYTSHRLFSIFPCRKSSTFLFTNNLKNKFIIKKEVRYIFDWLDYEIIISTLNKTSILLEPLDVTDSDIPIKEVDQRLKEAKTMLKDADFEKALEKLDRIPEEYKEKLKNTGILKENVGDWSKNIEKGLTSEDIEKKKWKGSKVFYESYYGIKKKSIYIKSYNVIIQKRIKKRLFLINTKESMGFC